MSEMCFGKARYDKKQAQTKRNQRLREGEPYLRIYPCPKCNHWHLTKLMPYKQQTAIYKKLEKRRRFHINDYELDS